MRRVVVSSSCVLVALACSSNPAELDAGKSDDAASADVCAPPSSADHVSLTFACQGSCSGSNDVTFSLTHRKGGSAPCVDADGHLQLYKLAGDDGSTLTLDVNPGYGGPGSYPLGSLGDVQYESGPVQCAEFGKVPITAYLPDSTDPSGSCTVTVASDCTLPNQHHAIAGTFICSFPVLSYGAHCSIENGSFSFASCE